MNVIIGLASLIISSLTWTPSYQTQIIKDLPADSYQSVCFMDTNDDKRGDLFAYYEKQQILRLSLQGENGFPASFEQEIALPDNTTWLALWDINEAPGQELLVSTSSGLWSFAQQDGNFAPEPRPVLQQPQILQNSMNGLILRFFHDPNERDFVPVVLTDRIEVFQVNPQGCSFQRRLELNLYREDWSLDTSDWAMNGQAGKSLWLQQNYRQPTFAEQSEPDSDSNVMEPLKKKLREDNQWYRVRDDALDLNHDDQEDWVVWASGGTFTARTIVFVFLRDPQGKLPSKPTQILRCQGVPIVSAINQWNVPMHDLDGDGIYELLIAELKESVTSWSHLVDVATSESINWRLTVRRLHGERYSRKAEERLDLQTTLGMSEGEFNMLTLAGDFNNDGRKDLCANQTGTQYRIYMSSAQNRFFTSDHSLTLNLPFNGYTEAYDINGDKIADIIIHDFDHQQIGLLFSQTETNQP